MLLCRHRHRRARRRSLGLQPVTSVGAREPGDHVGANRDVRDLAAGKLWPVKAKDHRGQHGSTVLTGGVSMSVPAVKKNEFSFSRII
jgi:hypothetical protein